MDLNAPKGAEFDRKELREGNKEVKKHFLRAVTDPGKKEINVKIMNRNSR